jgi:hypothetical protein
MSSAPVMMEACPLTPPSPSRGEGVPFEDNLLSPWGEDRGEGTVGTDG